MPAVFKREATRNQSPHNHPPTRRYEDKQPQRGLRAFARVYAGWGFSQAFYREHLYKKIGFSSLEGERARHIRPTL